MSEKHIAVFEMHDGSEYTEFSRECSLREACEWAKARAAKMGVKLKRLT